LKEGKITESSEGDKFAAKANLLSIIGRSCLRILESSLPNSSLLSEVGIAIEVSNSRMFSGLSPESEVAICLVGLGDNKSDIFEDGGYESG
jgi:hypothetical protein